MRLISSARTTLAKIGPLTKLHPPAAFVGFLEDLRARDVRRHQVGRELNPLELQVEDLGDRADQQGFRQPRRAGDQTMPSGEQADQELMRRLLLANDDLGKLAFDPAAALVNLLDDLSFVFVGIRFVRHDRSFQTRFNSSPKATVWDELPINASWRRSRC